MLKMMLALPAALCFVAAGFLLIHMYDDLRSGALHWRDQQAAIGAFLVLSHLAGGVVAMLGIVP